MREIFSDIERWFNGASWRTWLGHGLLTALWLGIWLALGAHPMVGVGAAWFYTIREAEQAFRRSGLPTDRVPEWVDRFVDVWVPWFVTALGYALV